MLKFENVNYDFMINIVYVMFIDDSSYKKLSSMSLVITINVDFIMNYNLYIHFNLKNITNFKWMTFNTKLVGTN